MCPECITFQDTLSFGQSLMSPLHAVDGIIHHFEVVTRTRDIDMTGVFDTIHFVKTVYPGQFPIVCFEIINRRFGKGAAISARFTIHGIADISFIGMELIFGLSFFIEPLQRFPCDMSPKCHSDNTNIVQIISFKQNFTICIDHSQYTKKFHVRPVFQHQFANQHFILPGTSQMYFLVLNLPFPLIIEKVTIQSLTHSQR